MAPLVMLTWEQVFKRQFDVFVIPIKPVYHHVIAHITIDHVL